MCNKKNVRMFTINVIYLGDAGRVVDYHIQYLGELPGSGSIDR